MIEIPIPTYARTPRKKLGNLKPVAAYFTHPFGFVRDPNLFGEYGRQTGPDLHKSHFGPTRTLEFRGEDLRLPYNVLIRTANPWGDWDYRADKILGVRTERRTCRLDALPGEDRIQEREFVVYQIEELPFAVQSQIFESMSFDPREERRKAEEKIQRGLPF